MYKISKQGGRGGGITYLAFLAYEDYVNLNLMLIMFRINYHFHYELITVASVPLPTRNSHAVE